MSEIKKGCIAKNSSGVIGVVTSETKVLTSRGHTAWVGIRLSPDNAGEPWYSKNPEHLADSIDKLINDGQ